ncbi:MAG: ABC transporter ATP-binding protein [Candidatus Paceibacterota bacterium]
MKLFLEYIARYKGIVTITLITASIGQIFSLLDTQIFRKLVDGYGMKAGSIPVDVFIKGVVFWLLIGVLLAFVSRLFVNIQTYFTNKLMQRVSTKMYNETLAHIFSLPYEIFVDEQSGSVLRKLEKARTDTQNVIQGIVANMFVPIVSVIFVLVYAYYVHIWAGLAYTAIIPILAFFTFAISRSIKKAQKEIVAKTSFLAGSTTETIRNIEMVKSLGLENEENKRLADVNESLLSLELKKIKLSRILAFIQGTAINLTRSLILLLLFYLLAKQDITFGEFFVLLFYSFALFGPLYEIGEVATKYQEAKGSLSSLEELRLKKPVQKPANAKVISSIEEIKLLNISATHNNSNSMSLDNVNLTIKKGQTIAFVGPSGAGKTTLLKIILGLLKNEKGEIKINGINNNELDYDSVRKLVGYVSQEAQLFAGTIRENLLFVSPNTTTKDCLSVIEKANCSSILERSSKGLDTIIGEGGVKLSGGERQRLAIARSLLRDPDILIFDEATSNLDSITERTITKTIEEISKDKKRIVLIVAHRLSTVRHADVIYVLKNGQIVESGDYKSLVAKDGLFNAMWREQSLGSDII